MNINALKNTLESLDENSLNEILDQRDDGAFDNEWVSTNKIVPDGEYHPNDKEMAPRYFMWVTQNQACWQSGRPC